MYRQIVIFFRLRCGAFPLRPSENALSGVYLRLFRHASNFSASAAVRLAVFSMGPRMEGFSVRYTELAPDRFKGFWKD